MPPQRHPIPRSGRHRRIKFCTRAERTLCGFDVKLGTVAIALDAAHIRWHQEGGPDAESNGLALCALHHKVFDLGAFTVAGGVLVVSDQANGSTGFQESFPTRRTAAPAFK